MAENTDNNGVPLQSKYNNPEYDKLASAQKEYYNTVINLKRKKDALLPSDRVGDSEDRLKGLFKAPQIRKGFIERLKGTKSMKQFFQEVTTTISLLIYLISFRDNIKIKKFIFSLSL